VEKMKMHSPNFMDANIEKLAELFPGCVTESADDKGNLKKSIDFDQLRQELSDSIVDGPQERYQLNWPGKKGSSSYRQCSHCQNLASLSGREC